jgi:uncharacterized membrane protein
MAVMAAGFSFGRILLWSPDPRRTWLLRIGLGMIAAFILLRFWNVYGDPRPWSTEATPELTFLSFLRTTKYPPSLQFLLMTLGPAMLLWAGLERLRLGRHNPLIVFGRVPLFYFLFHLYVIHALTYLFAFVRYGTVGFLTNPLPSLGGDQAAYPPDFGYNLPVVYAVWLLVLALMYPACRFFSQLKARRHDPWLSYL